MRCINCLNMKGLFTVVILLILLLIVYLLRSEEELNSHKPNDLQGAIPIVLWWTSILPVYFRTKKCGYYKCTFTVDRSYLYDEKTKVISFYGSDLNKTDLPLPRWSQHLWALFHEESPKNVPYIQHENFLKYFNITSTFSRHSNYPLTTQYLNSLELLKTRKYLTPVGDKSILRAKEKLAPVVFVQSICDTMSGRNEYVQELMKFIEVDSYGKCLNNRKLPENLTVDYLSKIDSEEFYRFLSRYKFIISYENGVCKDYISEKFWRPLIIGSIPIYFGAPNIKDWMPTAKSAIFISDYDSPEELAKHLKLLDANDYEYNSYLDHKYSQISPLTNKRLKESVLARDFNNENVFESFECFICKQIHDRKFKSVATRTHYDCPFPIELPPMQSKPNIKEWESSIKIGKCQADILDIFLTRNTNFTSREFIEKLTENIQSKVCEL